MRPGKPCLIKAADTIDPLVKDVIELTQRFLGSARIGEGPNARRRTAEVGSVRLRKSNCQVSEPPGDGGHRLALVRVTVIPGEISVPK